MLLLRGEQRQAMQLSPVSLDSQPLVTLLQVAGARCSAGPASRAHRGGGACGVRRTHAAARADGGRACARLDGLCGTTLLHHPPPPASRASPCQLGCSASLPSHFVSRTPPADARGPSTAAVSSTAVRGRLDAQRQRERAPPPERPVRLCAVRQSQRRTRRSRCRHS
jgi:hypothetical protein